MLKCKKTKLLSIWQMAITIGAPLVILVSLSSLTFSQSKALKQRHMLCRTTQRRCRSTFWNSPLKRLAHSPNLKHLSIFSSQVTNAGIPYLVNLKGLRFLNLASTKVNDACCKNIAQIQSLNEISFGWYAIQCKRDGSEEVWSQAAPEGAIGSMP